MSPSPGLTAVLSVDVFAMTQSTQPERNLFGPVLIVLAGSIERPVQMALRATSNHEKPFVGQGFGPAGRLLPGAELYVSR